MSEPEPPLHQRLLRDRRIFAGIALACAAGLGLGLLMKPTLSEDPTVLRSNRVVEIPREPDWAAIAPPVQAPPLPVTALAPPPAPVEEVAEVEPEPRQMRRFSSLPFGAPRPSFDCRYAQTEAEQMVCSDRRLAAADRRMASAFRRAQRAGVPDRVLRRQQDIWLDAREAAAHDAPEAVEEVYEARTAELEDMAEGY